MNDLFNVWRAASRMSVMTLGIVLTERTLPVPQA